MADLLRAIGSMLTTKLGVATFANETAHRGQTYPYIEVEKTAGGEQAQGPGKIVRYDDDGNPTHFVKKLRGDTQIQLAIVAKGENDGSSRKKCAALAEQVRTLFETIIYGNESVTFVDPVTATDCGVSSVTIGEMGGARADVRHDQLVHEATLPLRFLHRREVAVPVPRTLDKTTNRYPEA